MMEFRAPLLVLMALSTPAAAAAKNECIYDTDGTCWFFDCDASRGQTYCSDDHKCMCKVGYCANLYQKCVRASLLADSPPQSPAGNAHSSTFLVAAVVAMAVGGALVQVLLKRRRAAIAEPLLDVDK
eukprot:NODE_26744_length_539_cov_3.757282.p3 GENE.NODE_26744_length_539_cov_3.757282~~NODE_26744_length_539_cov_3.757282.p3  ORF type:complete len:127 (+),score=36.21 NODE_26744_length_539_cov_3.757282:70-450(+)